MPSFTERVGQVFHIYVDLAGLVGFEATVFWSRVLGLQIAQVPHSMAAQTAIQPRARGIRVQELPHHGKQIIERDQKRLAQGDRDNLLRGRHGRLQPMRRMAAIINAVALAPLVNSLRAHPKAFRKNRSSVIAVLNGRTDLRRGRSLLVKMDQNGRLPSRMSLRTDLAMNNADRRGEM